MSLKVFKKSSEDLLFKILKSNFTHALAKVQTAITELKVLTTDAPAEMPKEDITALEKFVEETTADLSKLI